MGTGRGYVAHGSGTQTAALSVAGGYAGQSPGINSSRTL